MTRRERLETKLAKRQEWAGKAAARSAQRFTAARRLADQIPLGQPILVGHYSERHARRDADRIGANMTKGVEEGKLAEHHTAKAGGLADQLDRSIFSDDENAVTQIEARIAECEAQRARMKAINIQIRRGAGWQARLREAGIELTDKEKADLLAVATHQPSYCDKKTGSPIFPPYALQNLGGNIARLKERIQAIEARAQRTILAEAQGGVMIEGQDYVRVTFAQKPARAILDALKAAGFAWGAGSWLGRRDRLPNTVTAPPSGPAT